MDVVTFEAKSRTPGKSAARAARRNDEVPCVLYGHHQEPVSFQVEELTLNKLIYTTEFHRVTVNLGSETYDCILKHVDFHPVSDRAMHADFQVLQAGETITLTIPIHYQGTAAGFRDGGRIYRPMNEVEIRCLPKDIPDFITVDVEKVEIGDTIHVSDLEVEGIEFLPPPETLIFAVLAEREELVEEDELGLGEEIDGMLDEDADEDAEDGDGDDEDQ